MAKLLMNLQFCRYFDPLRARPVCKSVADRLLVMRAMCRAAEISGIACPTGIVLEGGQ